MRNRKALAAAVVTDQKVNAALENLASIICDTMEALVTLSPNHALSVVNQLSEQINEETMKEQRDRDIEAMENIANMMHGEDDE